MARAPVAVRGDAEVVGSEAGEGSERAATDNEKKVAVAEGSTNSDIDAAPKPRGIKKIVGPKPDGPWYSGSVLFWYVKFAIFRGVDQDVVSMQNRKDVLSGDVEELHAHAAHYDNKAEYMYSFLQAMPAQPSVYTTKTALLSRQIRTLSALPPPPPDWRDNLPPADEHGDLADSAVHQVLYKLAVVARKHTNAVYNAQTLRHVAEQIDSLYRDGPADGEPSEQAEVLRAGVDLREKEYVIWPPRHLSAGETR